MIFDTSVRPYRPYQFPKVLVFLKIKQDMFKGGETTYNLNVTCLSYHNAGMFYSYFITSFTPSYYCASAYIYIYIYSYKQDLVLNNLEGLICHKTHPININFIIIALYNNILQDTRF